MDRARVPRVPTKAVWRLDACQKCVNNSCVTLQCKICNNFHPKRAFPESQLQKRGRQDRNTFLRCMHCHTCKICKEQKDIRAFHANSSACMKCHTSVTLQCEICNNFLPKRAFPDSQLQKKGRQDRNTFLRCVHCHTCKVCKEQKDIRAFHENSSACIQCRNSGKPCDGCHTKKPSTDYNPSVLHNASRGRKIVCVECIMQGLSPKDVNMYKCDECGDRGHRKFEPGQLQQHKNSKGQKKIVCTDCTDRQKQIERVLRLPKAWKCKCPGKGHDRHHRPENVKCDLVPVRMGEKRWPGKNVEVHPGQKIKNLMLQIGFYNLYQKQS